MGDKKLTEKQRLFIERYNVHGNGVRAAKEAGYKGTDNTLNQVARDNLQKPTIAAEIRKHQKATSERNAIDADWVNNRLASVAESSSSDAAVVSALNVLSKNLGIQNHEKKINMNTNVNTSVVDAIADFKKKKEDEENKIQ